MSLRFFIALLLTSISSITVWEGVRSAWAHPEYECDCDEAASNAVSDYEGEVEKCLEKSTDLEDGKSCTESVK